MPNKLTPEQREGLDGLQQFDLWRKLYPGDVAAIAKAKNLPAAVLAGHIEKLRGWVEKYRNSPRGKKKDWAKFLRINLPDLTGVKSHGYRKPVSVFRGESGEKKM